MGPQDEQEIAQQRRSNVWENLHSICECSGVEEVLQEQLASCKGKPYRQLLRNIAVGLRIAVFRYVDVSRFCPTPGALAAVAIADFILNLVASFMLVGRGGYFSYFAIPPFFFHLPLLLFFGFWAAKILSRPALLTVIPVALVSLSIPLEICHAIMEKIAQLQQFRWLEPFLDAPHYYRFFWWWSLASLIFLLRLKPASRVRRAAVALLFAVMVLVPLWYYSRGDLWMNPSAGAESGELHLTEEVLAAQPKLMEGELDAIQRGRKGMSDIYFVGFAGDASQDVFLKELGTTERLFSERFGTGGRAVILANNPQTATTLPFATAGNLERSLARVGQVMNRDEDVLFLFLTSHGSSDHVLAVNNHPLELEALTPENVQGMLKESGIVWKIVVVSACYSGGFIDALKDDRSLVITAADATHESFGCGNGEDMTWFGQAFINSGLRKTFSFTKAFEMAQGKIRQWEENEWETPSNPQIWVGKEMKPKLARLEKELETRQRAKPDPKLDNGGEGH